MQLNQRIDAWLQSLTVGGIQEERVFISMFGSMGFVVWVVT